MFRMGRVVSVADLLSQIARAAKDGPALLLNGRWEETPFCRAVRDARGLVSDQDGTTVAGSQWTDMRRCMTAEHAEADTADAARYFRGERSDEGDIRFILESVGRLRASKLTRARLREAARQQKPREGVADLFSTFPQGNTAVVSYGLHDYIDAWARAHRVPVAEIFAMRLCWREEGGEQYCDDAVADSVVTEATKGAARERFSDARGLHPRDVLVLEDTPDMLVRMKDGGNLGVLVVPAHDPQPGRTKARLRQLARGGFERIDAFLVADDWRPLVALRS